MNIWYFICREFWLYGRTFSPVNHNLKWYCLGTSIPTQRDCSFWQGTQNTLNAYNARLAELVASDGGCTCSALFINRVRITKSHIYRKRHVATGGFFIFPWGLASWPWSQKGMSWGHLELLHLCTLVSTWDGGGWRRWCHVGQVPWHMEAGSPGVNRMHSFLRGGRLRPHISQRGSLRSGEEWPGG